MKAMIFAAGLGTRLKPLTDTLPKALVPVSGKPLLEHVARRLMASGIDEAVVNVHHFADDIEAWISAQDWLCGNLEEKTPGKMLMQVSDERKMLLETGGAVLHARRYLGGCGNFLIHNVDILSDCDLPWLMDQVRPDAVGTLVVSSRSTTRYFLFHPQTLRLVGWTNVKTGECRMSDPTMSPEDCKAYAFTGIHVLSDRVFGLMAEYVQESELPSDECGTRFSIVDFYLWAAAKHPIYGVPVQDLKLLDVGKLAALGPAEEFVAQG
jgi:NDP-sugar pyrophosphorylase family protein